MKKLLLLLLLLVVVTLSACDTGGEDPEDQNYKEKDIIEDIQELFECEGYKDFVVVDGACIPMNNIVSKNIKINGTDTLVRHVNSIELMGDFVADLTGSKGLAVVSRDVFDTGMEASEIKLAGEENDNTDNLIVKLNDEGFFEEVSFADDNGVSVEVTSNPLALEVFGEFTVVIFEVNLGYNDSNQDFISKLYDSLYSGGIYLIHNETGKLFATKDVRFMEYTFTDFEDHSRNVMLTVTLNEPVVEMYEQELFDEYGKQILDENGNPVFETIENPLLDNDGNPVIFTEGPIKTEMIETPVFNYYEEAMLDDDGNKILDEDGNPKFELIEEPILDEDGVQKVDIQEVPMTDENGNLVYEEQFEVEIYIEDHLEITITEYNAEITENPLSPVAQRFVDKIISEYYNWNYYRVSNYRLDQNGFANNANGIFYIDWSEDKSDGTAPSQMLKKLSFDPEFEEIILEDFLDITKASFDECELIIDPLNNNVICNQWDSNLKLYSETLGLINIPNSEQLQPITFPNGELYFFDQQDSYVEELGYYTTALYTIDNIGTLETHYIELGERNDFCYGECLYSIEVDMLSEDGTLYGENYWADVTIGYGDHTIRKADLQLLELGTFDTSRADCDDANGCWFETMYEISNSEDELVMNVYTSSPVFPEDETPSFVEQYLLDSNTTYTYQREWVQTDMICENEIGCPNNINLIDDSINQHGLWLYDSFLIEQGAPFVQELRLPDENDAIYEYEKTIDGRLCESANCSEMVEIYILDEQGELLTQVGTIADFTQGETIPLRIEYRITDDTNIVYSTEACTQTYGCSSYLPLNEFISVDIPTNFGDMMYHSITFAETDIEDILSETLTKEICTYVDGCGNGDVIYEVLNNDGTVLYTFESYVHAEYGYKAPFKVTASIADFTIINQTDGSEEDAICIDTSCYAYPQVFLLNEDGTTTEIGMTDYQVSQGEKIIQSLTLSYLSHTNSIVDKVCTDANGCMINTNNYIIVDENGKEYQNTQNEWRNWIPVLFEYGTAIPNSEDFEATFIMTNMEYNKQRISVHDFMYNMQNVVVLEDNLYLIESQSWVQGDDNFILTFNEDTQRYQVKYTNMHAVLEITDFNDGYIAVSDDETSIIEFTFNEVESSEDYYYFDVINLTEGLLINGVNDLIVDYDGSIYFKGVDNFIQDITGSINEDGEITIDTEIVDHEVIRVRPIN